MKEKSEEEKAKAIAQIKEEEMQRKHKEAEADMKNLQLVDSCVNSYKASMQNYVGSTDNFFSQSDMEQKHESIKAEVLPMVWN